MISDRFCFDALRSILWNRNHPRSVHQCDNQYFSAGRSAKEFLKSILFTNNMQAIQITFFLLALVRFLGLVTASPLHRSPEHCTFDGLTAFIGTQSPLFDVDIL